MIHRCQNGVVQIKLTPSELHYAASTGLKRQIQNLYQDRTPLYGTNAADCWQWNIMGAIGECVVAKCLNVFWSGSLGDYDAADVGHLQVRATPHDDGRLVLHNRDSDDDLFILVTGAGPVFSIPGCIRGRDGKRNEYWTAPRAGRPAYFVPRSVLMPLTRELLREVEPT